MSKSLSVLAGVAQRIERWPANRRVAGWIPSQGMRLGCGPGPQLGAREKRAIRASMFLSLFLSLPSPLSKNKYIKSFKNILKIMYSGQSYFLFSLKK